MAGCNLPVNIYHTLAKRIVLDCSLSNESHKRQRVSAECCIRQDGIYFVFNDISNSDIFLCYFRNDLQELLLSVFVFVCR